MKVILFVTIIVLGGLSLATWLYLHLEEHMEWREWHVPRGTEFAPCPLEYGEHDGLLLTDVEYACFASMFVRQVRQCFSVVWADGFPRCRHRFPVM